MQKKVIAQHLAMAQNLVIARHLVIKPNLVNARHLVIVQHLVKNNQKLYIWYKYAPKVKHLVQKWNQKPLKSMSFTFRKQCGIHVTFNENRPQYF